MMLQISWKTDDGTERVEIFDNWREYQDWQASPTGAVLAARSGIHDLKETELTKVSFDEKI